MSAREQVASEIESYLVELGLNEVYGVVSGLSEDKKYRYATFCKARILDGVVHVYGPKFIQVRWETAIRRLPHRGSEVFRSLEAAKEFLRENFYYAKTEGVLPR